MSSNDNHYKKIYKEKKFRDTSCVKGIIFFLLVDHKKRLSFNIHQFLSMFYFEEDSGMKNLVWGKNPGPRS